MRPRQKRRNAGLSTPPSDPTYEPKANEFTANRKMEHTLKAAFAFGNNTTLTHALMELVFVRDPRNSRGGDASLQYQSVR